MGGYGAIRIGMKRPDVFSTLYVMSACCLINNPFPAPPANSKQNNTKGGGAPLQLNSAWAAAFSPNPKNPPAYFDEPIKDGHEQPLVIAKWHAASPLAMIDQYVTNLKKYHAIVGDVGLQDGLAGQNRQLYQMMTDFGIMHTFETYEGDHTNKIPERIETKVLPFFSKSLAAKLAAKSAGRLGQSPAAIPASSLICPAGHRHLVSPLDPAMRETRYYNSTERAQLCPFQGDTHEGRSRPGPLSEAVSRNARAAGFPSYARGYEFET
jgi:hypothetical protein